jgi:hypothetical protein
MPKGKGRGKKKAARKGARGGPNAQGRPTVVNGGMAIGFAGGSQPKTARAPRSNVNRRAHVHTVCSLMNPFCPAAKTAAYPDGKNANTLRTQIRCHVPMTAGKQVLDNSTAIAGTTTGNYVYINPSLVYAIYCADALAGSPAAYTLTYGPALPGNSIITTAGNKITNYRVVSFGVIIRCTSNVTNASGYLILGTHHCDANVAAATVVAGTTNYAEVETKAIFAGMEYSWVSKPIGADSTRFLDIPTGGATGFNPGWTSLAIEMVGGVANTTALDLEFFCNVELQMGGDSPLMPFASKAQPHNPVALQAQTRVATTMSSFIEGGVAKAEEWVTRHASAAVDDVLSSIGTLMAGLL